MPGATFAIQSAAGHALILAKPLSTRDGSALTASRNSSRNDFIWALAIISVIVSGLMLLYILRTLSPLYKQPKLPPPLFIITAREKDQDQTKLKPLIEVTTSASSTSPTTPHSPSPAEQDTPEGRLLVKTREDAEARRYQLLHPPSRRSKVTVDQERDISVLGRSIAWRFVVDGRGSCSSRDHKSLKVENAWIQEVRFLRKREKCIYSRMPMIADVELVGKKWCYFEVKILELCDSPLTKISIGVITIPYPTFRLCGSFKHSVGYRSDTGNLHQDDPDSGRPFGRPFGKNDIVGCGYDIGRGTVFFTLNGTLISDGSIGYMLHDYHMSVSANDQCVLLINVGSEPFVFQAANRASVLRAVTSPSDIVSSYEREESAESPEIHHEP